jgi:CDP-diacylglycerol--glycerol-3-phosphate 3-phosphatidyltransferase
MTGHAAPDPAAKAARRTSLAEDALNLPNLLTMGRIVMIPVFLWLLDRETPRMCFWAAIVFTLAAITSTATSRASWGS